MSKKFPNFTSPSVTELNSQSMLTLCIVRNPFESLWFTISPISQQIVVIFKSYAKTPPQATPE